MADYSQAEIQTAVEKVVQSTIRRPYGPLGNRDVQVTFNDLQDAAAGVYILSPNAPFYTVFLGTLRLAELLSDEQDTINSLIEAIENTNRQVTDIDNLAPLNNARAALDALNGAAGGRNTLFQDIEDVPAFQRYDANVQRFLNDSAANSRKNGQIVPTPEESRASLAGLVRQLSSQQDDVLSRAGFLVAAIDDYDSLNLPSLLAQGVMTNTRNVLNGHIEDLEAVTPKQRLSQMRDVTLDLLVGRAAVAGLGSLRATTTFALIEGTGVVFTDEDHPANVADLAATTLGPYPIFNGASDLDFTMDGSFAFSATVPGSFVASAQSSLPQPYNVVAGQNDAFSFDVETATGTVRTSFVLPAGVSSADDIATFLNACIPGAVPILADTVFQVFRFLGVVDANATGSSSDMDFILPAPGTWDALGTKVGDLVVITDPLSPQVGSQFQVDTGGIVGDTLTCTQLSGVAPADETLVEIEVGIQKTVRLRVRDADVLDSLTDRTALIFPVDADQSALEGNLDPVSPEIQPFGFVIGAQIRSRSTLASQVASDVPLAASAQQQGVPRLTASTEFVASVFSGLGRSDPDQPNVLVAYRIRSRGDVAAGQFSVIFPVSDPTAAGVTVGDILVVRETPILDDQNVQGTVITVNTDNVVVDMQVAITGGTDLLYEIGPDLTLNSEYLEAQVTESASQDGNYFMDPRGQRDIPFEFSFEQQVPFNRDPGGLPVFFTLALGYFRVRFQSTTQDLSTQVAVTGGGAAGQFFPTVPTATVGTTSFFQLPLDPKSLQVGDTLELNETIYNVVSQSNTITALELSQLLVVLDPPLATDLPAVNMSLKSTVPFGRIRLSKKNNFVVFEDQLEAWLALPPNQPAFFVELQRLLNPLIINLNPTASQVNSAKLHVQTLLAILTRQGAIVTSADPDDSLETILSSYTISPVEDVDVLVDSFLERGAIRGIDILLQGRFSTFFGLNLEQMSFDGAAREALRAVQRLDLPIRKTGRLGNLADAQTLAEYDDPDFDFDFSDTENDVDVEIPAEFAEITPPGR